MMRVLKFGWLFWAALCAAYVATAAERPSTPLWQGLATGQYVAVMRHATAPGTGDPDDFALGDCSTQRNLSAAGRAEARAIGARFRAHGIESASVRSSQWCRCLETARLLGIGRVVPTPALNSFFEDRDEGAAQTAAVVALLDNWADGPRVLVTHQVNVTALTDVFPASGEIVVVEPLRDRMRVVGRIDPPEDANG